MIRPIVTLTTDFGTRDSYVGAMKGVILSRCADAAIIDISHEIAPQSISEGAYVLATAAAHFPPHAVHVAIVDPGVGSDRTPIAVSTPIGTFVAPDNGILSHVVGVLEQPPEHDRPADGSAAGCEAQSLIRVRLPEGLRAVALDQPSFWLPEVSRTFHGRDIFAPVAAHAAAGVPLSRLGSPIDEITVLRSALRATRPQAGDAVRGVIVHIDRYGNLITDIPAETLPRGVRVHVAGRQVDGLSRSYSERVGELLAIVGSQATLEIAVGGGSAAETLSANVGDAVSVTRPAAQPAPTA